VLVRVVGTGLCHTDLVVRDQVLPTPLPAVLGHGGRPRSIDATSSLKSYTLSKGILVCGVAEGDADPQTIQPCWSIFTGGTLSFR
jgi:D-arabinose 1-dehydrogenase-like Zn-dependent alcohol dehydrogenase